MQKTLALCLAILCAMAAGTALAADAESLFTVQRLTDKVTIFTEISPWRSNHVVIEPYRCSLEINPDNTNGIEAIERLRAGAETD